jgi:DNA invertase Pin-like site-specific DNA recombinase
MTENATTARRAIAYLRVSTEEQGVSGLGLDAQRATIEAWAEREGVAVEYVTEVQSGKNITRRPLLREGPRARP